MNPTPSCKERREDYLFGLMDKQQELAFEQHLETCTQCQQELEAHMAMTQLFLPPAMPQESVSQEEHTHLLAFVFEQLPEPQEPKAQVTPSLVSSQESKNIPENENQALSWLDKLIDSLFGPRQAWYSISATVATACLLLAIWLPEMPHPEHRVASSQAKSERHKTSAPHKRLASKAPKASKSARPYTPSKARSVLKFGDIQVLAKITKGVSLTTEPEHIEVNVQYDPKDFLAVSVDSSQKSTHQKRSIGSSEHDVENKIFKVHHREPMEDKLPKHRPQPPKQVGITTLKDHKIQAHNMVGEYKISHYFN